MNAILGIAFGPLAFVLCARWAARNFGNAEEGEQGCWPVIVCWLWALLAVLGFVLILIKASSYS